MVQPQGTEILLTSASLEDEKSIAEPRKVASVSRAVSAFAPEFTRTFAPRSSTILRVKIAKARAGR
jgi:hypothetical protein